MWRHNIDEVSVDGGIEHEEGTSSSDAQACLLRGLPLSPASDVKSKHTLTQSRVCYKKESFVNDDICHVISPRLGAKRLRSH